MRYINSCFTYLLTYLLCHLFWPSQYTVCTRYESHNIVTIDSEVVGVGEVLLNKARPLFANLADLLVAVGVKHLKTPNIHHKISQLYKMRCIL